MILVLFPTVVLILCLLYEVYYYLVYLSDAARAVAGEDGPVPADGGSDDHTGSVPDDIPKLTPAAEGGDVVRARSALRREEDSGVDERPNGIESHNRSTVNIETLNLIVSPDDARYTGRTTPVSSMTDSVEGLPLLDLERATAFQENEPIGVEHLFEKGGSLGMRYQTEKRSLEYAVGGDARQTEPHKIVNERKQHGID